MEKRISEDKIRRSVTSLRFNQSVNRSGPGSVKVNRKRGSEVSIGPKATSSIVSVRSRQCINEQDALNLMLENIIQHRKSQMMV